VRALALALTLVSGLVAGCTGGGEQAAAPVDTATCSDVLYEGEGKPNAIIVSDTDLRGANRASATATVRAIKGVLRQRGFRAGDYRIGYQSCYSDDDGDCERNAKAYAATTHVLGVIGPWFSGCAALQIPILSRRAAGPLAMVSPTNTDRGLTRRTRYSDRDPDSLYVDGVRNYVRVVAPDDNEGAAAATLAKQMGARRVVAFVNRGKIGFGWYGPTLGGAFVDTARRLGLVTTEFEWRKQRSYAAIAKRAAAKRPQLVFFAGHTQYNARRLMEDLRRQLGPGVVFAAGSQFAAGFSPRDYGRVGEGLRVTGYGATPETLAPPARRFLRSVDAPDDYVDFAEVAQGAQAAGVLLDAIARSDGTRAVVVEELFHTRVTGGILGSFSFDRYGDISPATTGLYSIRNGELVLDGVVRVPSSD
jgi:branched-chain amino acid transport system substrate-binding protein